jgi:hypothetical protein
MVTQDSLGEDVRHESGSVTFLDWKHLDFEQAVGQSTGSVQPIGSSHRRKT